jgi:acetate---CoA ligase (ADP-forming)
VDAVVSQSLVPLFNPRSVAVIGASEAPGNRGGQAVRLLRKFSFRGTVTAVHPSGDSVAGYPGVKSLSELTQTPDVALVGLAARHAVQAIEDIGRAGIRSAIVWAGGFSEGGADGARQQRSLAAAASRAGVRMLGPNCLGLVNTTLGFCGTFAAWLVSADELLPGHISMVTQSGGLGAAAHAMAQSTGIGFRFMASTGNEADVSAVDVLDLFADDTATHIICCYLEGVTDGKRLIAAFERARRGGKHVVVLKGGRSAASARAVAAHTGALAGQARVWDAVLESAGAIQVFSLDELVDVATCLESNWGKPVPRGRRVAVLGFGGGSGVLAADQCSAAQLEVPPLSAATRGALASLVPAIASLQNPVDLTPEASNREQYRRHLPEVLRLIDASAEADLILLQGGAMARGADEVAARMRDFARTSVSYASVYWPSIPDSAATVFRGAGVPVFGQQRQAIAALGRIALAIPDDTLAGSHGPDGPAACGLPTAGLRLPPATDGQVLGEDQVHDILRAAGLPTLPGRLARSADEAVGIAATVGAPVAMKVVSESITHRAQAGLVRLNMAGEAAIRDAFGDLMSSAREQGGDPHGVYIQRMGPAGTEFLISAFRDETFGTIVSCGAGGIYTELLDDIAFAPAPLTIAQARRLIGGLRIAAYLEAHGKAAALGALAPFLTGLSSLAAAIPWPRFTLEINPAVVTPDETVALDGLLIVDRAVAETAAD